MTYLKQLLLVFVLLSLVVPIFVSAQSCADSDGGINDKVKGRVEIANNPNNYTDFCLEYPRDTVDEYFCDHGGLGQDLIKCEYGCNDGACRTEPAPAEPVSNDSPFPIAPVSQEYRERDVDVVPSFYFDNNTTLILVIALIIGLIVVSRSFKNQNQNKVLFVLISVIALSLAGFMSYKYFFSKSGTSDKSNRKDITSFCTRDRCYECSRPIQGKLTRVISQAGTPVDVYMPVNANEANLFCQATGYVEYEGKLKVLQKPEVLEMIGKYEYRDVSIKALEFELIGDKNFVHRLLPDYKNEEIGCIIILQTPDGGMVYLEDEELETFEQMEYDLFMQRLNKVSPADKQLFLDNLR